MKVIFYLLIWVKAEIKIADGILVAAGSVVTKSFNKKNIIIGGVPAKKSH